MDILINLGLALAISVAITSTWWYFLRPKHLWSADPESRFKDYSLFRRRWILGGKLLLRKELLFPFMCYVIKDKNGDGIADYKALLVCAGRASRTEEKELDELDIEAYEFALEEWKKLQAKEQALV